MMDRTILQPVPAPGAWAIECRECGETAPTEYDCREDAVDAIDLGDLDTHHCLAQTTEG